MRIDYCPQCKKAGLKYERIHIPSWYVKTPEQQAIWDENKLHQSNGKKWCPRCQQWVTPMQGEWHRNTGTVIQSTLQEVK